MPSTKPLSPFQFRPEEKEQFVGFSVRTGKVSYYIRYRDPVSHRNKEVVGGKTQTEVIEKLRELAPAIRVGRVVVSPTTLFYEVVEAWFEQEIIPHKKPSTEDNYRYYTERFLLPTFEGQRFSHVTRPVLDEFFARLEDFDSADPTRKKQVEVSFDNVQQVKKVTKSLFRWAHVQGYSPTNEAAHLVVAANPERKEIVTYSPEQFETLLGYVNPYYRPHLMTLFYSSMRWGEMAALPWTNVDFRPDGRVDIYISQALSGGTLAAPKTKKSRRTITLPAFIAGVLRAHKLEQDATQPPHAEGFVFTSMGALTLNATRFRQRIYYHALTRANKDLRARELQELPKVKLHELRHSTISVLALQPALANVVVQQHAGHSNAATTDRYTHVDELRRNLVADVLENAHNTAVGGGASSAEAVPETA